MKKRSTASHDYSLTLMNTVSTDDSIIMIMENRSLLNNCCFSCRNCAVCILQGRVILLDSDDGSSFIVIDTASFADVLKTTVASLPASRTHESNVINALASCRLICNVRNVSMDEVQNVWVTSLPTEPTVDWVCLLRILPPLEHHKLLHYVLLKLYFTYFLWWFSTIFLSICVSCLWACLCPWCSAVRKKAIGPLLFMSLCWQQLWYLHF